MAESIAASDALLGTTAVSEFDAARCRRWFWMFAAAHLIVWTIVPAVTQPNAPLDVVEITYWGHQWQLGYAKHPPLPSWLSEGVYALSGQHVWAIYLLAQVATVVCFWAVWRLALKMLAPLQALLAVMVLEGCCFYNYVTPEFNHGVCLNMFWALSALCFYRAITAGRSWDWIATGICLGLGMLTKYNVITLAVPMVALLIWDRSLRRFWRSPGPYLTMAATALIFAPHAWWAFSRSLTTITYALERTESTSSFVSRFVNPLWFTCGQVLIALPILACVLPLLGVRFRWPLSSDTSRLQKQFVVFICFGPWLVCLLISLLGNMSLRMEHGAALWMFLGLYYFALFETSRQPRAVRRTAILIGTFAMLAVATALVRNVVGPYLQHRGSRVHFPGQQLATAVENAWHQDFRQPLPLIGGEWWLAGNVNLYGRDRAAVFASGNDPQSILMPPALSDWTGDEDLRRRGGIIVWSVARHGGSFPSELSKRFPVHGASQTVLLPWQTAAQLTPLELGFAVLPPLAEQESFAARHGQGMRRR